MAVGQNKINESGELEYLPLASNTKVTMALAISNSIVPALALTILMKLIYQSGKQLRGVGKDVVVAVRRD